MNIWDVANVVGIARILAGLTVGISSSTCSTRSHPAPVRLGARRGHAQR